MANRSSLKTLMRRMVEIGNTPVWTFTVNRRRYADAAGSRVRQFSLRGELQRGSRTPYAINGEDIVVNSDTWVIGNLTPGAVASVKGVVKTGVGRCATKIVVSGSLH